MDDGLIACVVASNRVLYAGPPLSDGTSRTAYAAGETIRLPPGEAAHLRAAGFLLKADGTAAQPAGPGPMPPGPDGVFVPGLARG